MLWSQRCNVSCKQYLMLFGWCYVWWMPEKHKTNLDGLLTERLWDSEAKTEASPIFPEVIVLSLLCSVLSLTSSQSQRLCCWTSLNCKDVFCISVMMVDTQWGGALLGSVNLTTTEVTWEEGASVTPFRSVRHIYGALSWGIMDVGEPSLLWMEPLLGRWSGRFKKGSLEVSQ